MRAITMWIFLLVALIVGSVQLNAQPQLRIEKLGLPPYIGSMKIFGEKAFMNSFDGLYVFDEASRTWRSLGQQSSLVELRQIMTVHPNGLVVSHVPLGTLRFQPKTEEIILEAGVYHQYQFVHSDSIVGLVQTSGDRSVRFVWKRWPSLEVIRTDTVDLGEEHAFSDVIPCSDGSILTLSPNKLVRFRYEDKPAVIPLGDNVLSGRHSYYVDSSRTHIALHAERGILLSSDQFASWTMYGDSSASRSANLHLTSDPNNIIVMNRGLLTRFNPANSRVDTLVRGSNLSDNVSASSDVVIASTRDSILFILETTTTTEHAGLQERGAQFLYGVNDGIVATTPEDVFVRPSGDVWTRCPLDKNVFANAQFSPLVIPSGGTSVDDFWLSVHGFFPVHVRPRTSILKSDVFFPGYSSNGFHPSSDRYYFTVLYALEMPCGSNQVMWIEGNSPLRTLLCKDDLRYLMVFNDRDYVAFTLKGSLWRTVDGDLDRWSQHPIPVLSLRPQPRMMTKGNHGLLTDQRTTMWTHDAGLTWESAVDSLEAHSTLTRAGDIISAHIQGDSNAVLIIDVLRNGVRSTYASLTSDFVDFARISIQDIAFDDNERRLYFTTNYYTASILLDGISSVEQEPREAHLEVGIPLGIYDLLGRRVAGDESEVETPGLYLHVQQYGVRKIIVQR
ncbi:MAG: hypothetical protein IPI29_03260 [Ignavibacteria bacterium]|nr:hypothetical protein [Ignavibacteria bacterium]